MLWERDENVVGKRWRSCVKHVEHVELSKEAVKELCGKEMEV